MSSTRNLLLTAVFCGALGAASADAQTPHHKPAASKPVPAQPVPAPAQAPKPEEPMAGEQVDGQAPDGPTRLEFDTLLGRYRPSIHPGDPLVIVGLEQGDNDLRSGTPMLARGDLTPQLVNTDEAYKRALAMYGDNQEFHSPPRPAIGAEPVAIEPRHRAAPKAPVESAPKPQKPEAAPWSLLSGLLVSALLIVWFLVRVRPALIAPREAAVPQPEPFVWNPVRRAGPRPTGNPSDPAATLPRPARVAQKPRQR